MILLVKAAVLWQFRLPCFCVSITPGLSVKLRQIPSALVVVLLEIVRHVVGHVQGGSTSFVAVGIVWLKGKLAATVLKLVR